MPENDIRKVVMIGDVIGKSGLDMLSERLPRLIREVSPDLVVANGENAASGFGLTRETASALFQSGVDVITSGNHIWEKKDVDVLLKDEIRILRPANYPKEAPGCGFIVVEKRSMRWLVINLQGREGMKAIDCPFKVASAIITEHPEALAILDFHAESASEKEALALYLDGSVVAFAGTHTHVQTADERILPKGSGYITDLGMCGPIDSVIGVKSDICLRRSLTQMPIKMEVAEGRSELRGAIFELDAAKRICIRVERIAV
jgi:hypothetical protein